MWRDYPGKGSRSMGLEQRQVSIPSSGLPLFWGTPPKNRVIWICLMNLDSNNQLLICSTKTSEGWNYALLIWDLVQLGTGWSWIKCCHAVHHGDMFMKGLPLMPRSYYKSNSLEKLWISESIMVRGLNVCPGVTPHLKMEFKYLQNGLSWHSCSILKMNDPVKC